MILIDRVRGGRGWGKIRVHGPSRGAAPQRPREPEVGARLDLSRRAAEHFSPGRKPWVDVRDRASPGGAKEDTLTRNLLWAWVKVRDCEPLRKAESIDFELDDD